MTKIEYPIFNQRISIENINWLKKEKKKYKTWNKFFDELIKKYGL